MGINPFPHYYHFYSPQSDRSKYLSYLERLSSFIAWLLENGYPVLLFPTQIRADTLVIQDVMELLAGRGIQASADRLLVPRIETVEELMEQLASLDLVVATRFHGILLPFLLHKPVLGISNHHKMSDLMMAMGQGEYLLDIERFDLESIIQRFQALEASAEAVKARIDERVKVFRKALEYQYLGALQSTGR